MNATELFLGLMGLLVGLFVIALIKPKLTPKASMTKFKDELYKQLPNYDLMVKEDTPARIIVSLNGTQKAIIVMDTPKKDYVMGGVTIFTTNKHTHLKHITQKIRQYEMVIN